MLSRSRALPALVLAAAMSLSTPAFAQREREALPRDTGNDFVIVGLGGAIMPDYEGSDDNTWTPMPIAIGSAGGFNFQLLGNRLSVDLIPDNTGRPGWDVQAGPVGLLNLNRATTKGIDDPRVKALGKLGTGIELGGYAGIARTGLITSQYDRLSVTVSYRRDVNNVSDSGIFTPSVTYLTPLSRKTVVGVFASAERIENKYADTYFGVTPAGSAASGLPVYDPNGGWKSWTVGVGGSIALTGDIQHGLQLGAGGTYRKLINDAADSPITRIAGSPNQWMGMVGLAYSF